MWSGHYRAKTEYVLIILSYNIDTEEIAGEFSTKSIESDLIRLLASTSVATSASIDTTMTIRKFLSRPHISHHHHLGCFFSTIVLAGSAIVSCCSNYVSLAYDRPFKPWCIYYTHSRFISVHEIGRECPPCPQSHRGSWKRRTHHTFSMILTERKSCRSTGIFKSKYDSAWFIKQM